MLNFGYMTEQIKDIIKQGASTRISDKEFLELEIMRWKGSPERLAQIKGYLYYRGDHDILLRRRTAIGDDGQLIEVKNLPNNRNIDNQYAKMVNQKANYLCGNPFKIKCDNAQYTELLKTMFDKKFMRTIKNATKGCLNAGISWLYPHYKGTGELCFRMFPGYEILPFWADGEHSVLDMAIRLYLVEGYEGIVPTLIEKVEVYDQQGVHRYILEGNKLIQDVDGEAEHMHLMVDGGGVNWERIPLIPFKANESEIPLIKRVKSLQDGINVMISDFENNMQEDGQNTILVITNYDGEDLGKFRQNLSTYRAVKVRNEGSGANGGVETLEITVNSENYKTILEIFKKALIENAMGYDAKDDRLSGDANQMNIQSMYSDIDLDANDMETEFQAAFEQVLWFVNAHFANTGRGDFASEQINIEFDRDMLMNESEIIANCSTSIGIISDETIIANHPWVKDPKKEMELLEAQRQKEREEMEAQQYAPFGNTGHDDGGDLNEE
jgi:SPP1 family phage portal protein